MKQIVLSRYLFIDQYCTCQKIVLQFYLYGYPQGGKDGTTTGGGGGTYWGTG